MYPFNIFAQSIILFVLGVLLILRSTTTQAVDRFFGVILVVFSITKLLEFVSLKYTTEQSGRSIAFFVWFVPLILLVACFAEKRRPDLFAAVLMSLFFLVYNMVQLMSNFSDKYRITSPDRNVGPSDGLFGWVRHDANNVQIPFFPLFFYLILTVAVVYTIGTFVSNLTFWLLAASTAVSCIVGGLIINMYHGEVMTYFWSMFSIALIAIGTFITLLSPG